MLEQNIYNLNTKYLWSSSLQFNQIGSCNMKTERVGQLGSIFQSKRVLPLLLILLFSNILFESRELELNSILRCSKMDKHVNIKCTQWNNFI